MGPPILTSMNGTRDLITKKIKLSCDVQLKSYQEIILLSPKQNSNRYLLFAVINFTCTIDLIVDL